MVHNPASLGAQDYREGAMLRLADANLLSDGEGWVGAVYLAGRAVESLFRSLLWSVDRRPEVGHDLRELLKRVRSLELLRGACGRGVEELEDAVNELAAVWRNDLRYTGTKRFVRLLRASGRSQRIGARPVKGDPVKANALSVLEACEKIISIGEPLCPRSKGD